MNFNVRYRNKEGSIVTIDIEADSKSAVFPILKEKGINAISINQQEKRKVRKTANKNSKIFASLIVAIICLVGAFLVVYLANTDKKEVPKESPIPKQIERSKKEVQISKKDDSVILPSNKKRPIKKLTVDRKSAVATPNLSSNSIVITYGMVNGKSIFKRPVFKHNSENLICAVLQTTPGTRIIDIPLGKRFEQDFAASMASPIRVEEGDTEEEIELKQMMVDVKSELVERVKNGENLSEIIENARADLNKLAQYNEDVRRAYFDMRNSAKSIEEVEEFRLAANKLLEERGIPPIQAAKRGKYKVDNPIDLDGPRKNKE